MPKTHSTKTRASLLFLKEGVKKLHIQGSLLPSSKYLGRRIVRRIPMKEKMLIVELGAGTGVFTEIILAKMPKNGILLAFETNHILAEHLRRNLNDPRLIIIEDDAAKLAKHLSEKALPLADCVVSGLPFGDFSRTKRQQLLSAIREGLHENGKYLQFQYLPLSLAHIKEMFKAKVIGYELRNFPPAFLYECRKL